MYMTQIAPFQININIPLHVDRLHHRMSLITDFPITKSPSYSLYV